MSKHIFINCPFDKRYSNKFRIILFSIIAYGFTPRCSLEKIGSGTTRYNKLLDIIRMCRYGIHDISRTSLDSANRLPRFNMPYELGLFIGMNYRKKEWDCLIVDIDKYRYQKFISDLAGNDIEPYKDQKTLAEVICRWLEQIQITEKLEPSGPTGGKVFALYNDFEKDYEKIRKAAGIEPDIYHNYQFYTRTAKKWLSRLEFDEDFIL